MEGGAGRGRDDDESEDGRGGFRNELVSRSLLRVALRAGERREGLGDGMTL